MIKRFFYWVSECWNLIMNVRVNPLKHINEPSIQAYFMLVLFTMWSVFFGFIATYYLGWYGYDTVTSIVVHLTVLIPIIFTNAVFRDAEREGHKWLKNLKNSETRTKHQTHPTCLLYTSPSPRDGLLSRMPSSA